MTNSLYLRFGLVVSYCIVSFTFIKDILGGLIFRILLHLIGSPSILFKIIGILYIICLLVWLFPLRGDVAKPIWLISSVILVSPLLLNLFWQIREKNIELSFIVPTTIFFVFLLLQWKELLKK